MKTRRTFGRLIGILAPALLLAACSGGSSPAPSAGTLGEPAQSVSALHSGAQGYAVTVLGSLGGTYSAGISVNDLGTIGGFSATSSSNTVLHAAIWQPLSTTPTDLGTLGGPNSGIEWPNHNAFFVVGISQTAQTDPLGEQWSCSAFIPYTGKTCLGFVSNGRTMVALPTLGGNNGFATGANGRGEVVGWAETTVHDPTCVPPQVLQFEAVLWDLAHRPHALAPLPGDSDSAATAINNEGDVVGISGICQNAVGDLSAEHAVLWHDGTPINIGNLGGAGWNTPMAINNLGEVVGFSDQTGDDDGNAPNSQAFSWTKTGGIENLHALPGDVLSQALGVNDEGQIVGLSCPTVTCATSRAFIWQGGVMTDLNSLVPAGSPYLVYANDINDRGVITGLAVTQSGAAVAFRAVPSRRGVLSVSTRSTESEAAAAQSFQSLGLHLGPFGRIVPNIP